MPSIKLKVAGSSSRRASVNERSEAPSKSRKKRRIVFDDEGEGDYSTPESEGEGEQGDNEQHTAERQTRSSRLKRSMNQTEALDPDRLFDDDANVDIVNDIPDRAPTPGAGPLPPSPGPSSRKQRGTSTVANASMSKAKGRTRKRATAIYSDDEDEDDGYVDVGRKQDDKDDDEFVIDSPPRKSGSSGKKGGAGAKGRGGKAGKDKGGGIGEIMIKDERKLPATASSSAGPPGVPAGDGKKRRRETITEANVPAAGAQPGAAGIFAAQGTSTASSQPSKEGVPPVATGTTQPPSKIRKLPPIKKNKNLAGASSAGPSSGFSTPGVPTGAPASATAESAAKSGTGAAAASTNASASANTSASLTGLPLVASLPRKPVQKTSDVDLTSPDIYNSLFKTGSSAPRVGVNSRLKEEERRRELMKMRDEARAARMANLQKSTFSLLTAQDKVGRFEEKLRMRNSPGIYPNHLGSALKFIVLRRSNGFPIRPFRKAGAVGSEGAAGETGGSGAGTSQGAGG